MSSEEATTLVRLRQLHRRRWTKLSLLLFLFVTAICGLWAWSAYRADRSLHDIVAETDRLDPGWRIADIESKRAKYPPEQNAALLVQAIHAKFKPGSTRLDMKRWLEEPAPAALLNEKELKSIQRVTTASGDAIVEARKLIDFPHGRYDIRYTGSTATPNEKAGYNLSVCNLLLADAVDLAQSGDAAGALRSVHAAYHAGSSIGDEPFTFSQLIRLSCQLTALTALERVLAQGEPAEPLLAALQSRLEAEEPASILPTVARAERSGQLQLLEAIEAGTLDGGYLFGRAPSKSFDPTSLLARVPGVVARNAAALMRFMNDVVEISKQPPEEWHAKFDTLQHQSANHPPVVQNVARLLIDVAAADTQRCLARQRCAIVALAAERFRRNNNRWPESLEELKRFGLLKVIPNDPYVGGPVKWKRTTDGIIIYTVGQDLKDDGGLLNRTDTEKLGSDLGFQLWDSAQRRLRAD